MRWSGFEEPRLATDRSHLLVIDIDSIIVVLHRVHIEVRAPLKGCVVLENYSRWRRVKLLGRWNVAQSD